MKTTTFARPRLNGTSYAMRIVCVMPHFRSSFGSNGTTTCEHFHSIDCTVYLPTIDLNLFLFFKSLCALTTMAMTIDSGARSTTSHRTHRNHLENSARSSIDFTINTENACKLQNGFVSIGVGVGVCVCVSHQRGIQMYIDLNTCSIRSHRVHVLQMMCDRARQIVNTCKLRAQNPSAFQTQAHTHTQSRTKFQIHR